MMLPPAQNAQNNIPLLQKAIMDKYFCRPANYLGCMGMGTSGTFMKAVAMPAWMAYVRSFYFLTLSRFLISGVGNNIFP